MIRVPTSTYRLQFHAGFGFRDALARIPYLAELGAGDLYASPVTRARAGSQHGYDVVDSSILNPELGAQEDFDALGRALKERDMGWLQDIVPNHMAFDSQNKLLMDVLENGPDSRFANYFDIEWQHNEPSLRGKLLVPFLGRPFGECLEAGEIQLAFGPDGLSVAYFQLVLPLRPETYADVLIHNLNILRRRMDKHHPDFVKLMGVFYFLRNFANHQEKEDREDRLTPEERYDQVRFFKAMLWELYGSNPVIQIFMDDNLRTCNGEKGKPESFNRLFQLLQRQHYRLAYWKAGREEINYRRFFAINDLISLRVEDEAVYRKTHAFALKLAQEGRWTGLRVDHIDGLYDPAAYLERLRADAPAAYVAVEKILDRTEALKPWPVQGSTGYDFMVAANGLFCRADNRAFFDTIYRDYTGLEADYAALAEEKKRLIIERDLFGGLENLAHQLKAIASKFRYGSDFTMFGFRNALTEVMVHFPVYRTYASPAGVDQGDEAIVRRAADQARARMPVHVKEIDFIERMLLAPLDPAFGKDELARALEFAMRLQQFTSPLMAKGIEDTLLYVYNRLISLNEVGGSPDAFGTTLEEFHAFNRARSRDWPGTMNALMTHDAKRGEDARARINVLSELPGEWQERLKAWRKLTSGWKRRRGGAELPDRNDEYFLYQTLIGAYPDREGELAGFPERLQAYAEKAVREAKVHTGWVKPDEEYEEAYREFAGRLLEGGDNPFLRDFLPFRAKVRFYGNLNGLSQTLLKLACPGVPDTYQGSELWDLRMVDPDNRAPVDYDLRERLLAEAEARGGAPDPEWLAGLLRDDPDGLAKLFLVHAGLRARKREPDLFARGDYRPLEAEGRWRSHVAAFARTAGDRQALCLVPRFLVSVTPEGRPPLGAEAWKDTAVLLPPELRGRWRDALTGQALEAGERLPAGEAWSRFTVALLLRD